MAAVITHKDFNIVAPLCDDLVESWLTRIVITCRTSINKYYPLSCLLVLEEQVQAADQLVMPGSHEEKFG
jgi:hypothetical protein